MEVGSPVRMDVILPDTTPRRTIGLIAEVIN